MLEPGLHDGIGLDGMGWGGIGLGERVCVGMCKEMGSWCFIVGGFRCGVYRKLVLLQTIGASVRILTSFSCYLTSVQALFRRSLAIYSIFSHIYKDRS